MKGSGRRESDVFQTQNYFAIPNGIPAPLTLYPDITQNNENWIQFFSEPSMFLFHFETDLAILHILLINL